MKLYSYILTDDRGAMPNPFWGVCTLALCKPAIRRGAAVGDWLMATGPARAATKNKLVYAMQVQECVPLEAYFLDKRFAAKKPDVASGDWRKRVGDNMYFKKGEKWGSLPGPRGKESFEKDVSGKRALISEHFYYFGGTAIALPEELHPLIHRNQGHRCKFPEELIGRFVAWLGKNHKVGIHGEPTGGAVAGGA